MFLDNCLVGILHTDPFGGRLVLTLFQLEVGRRLLSLYQRSGVGFILQNTDNGSRRPFTVLAIRIAAFCMGHPVIAFICQWGKYAHPVQFIRNMGSAKPFQTLSENIPHHTRRIFVNFQTFMLIAGFYITVNGKGSDKITAAAFHIQGAPGLYRNIPAVCLIHNIFDRDGKVIGSIGFRVHVIIDGDKTDAVSREHPAHITASFYVFASQAGKVFYNYAVGLALLDHPHHFLEGRTVKKNAAVAVVNLFRNNLNFRMPGNVVVDQPPLVGNAVAFH